MDDGERRKLVFTNLLNGLPVASITATFHLSEAEVMADFKFVMQKLRSYRFERAMVPVEGETIQLAIHHKVEHLYTLTRLNLEKPAAFARIVHLPFTQDPGGGISEAERVMRDMQLRAGSR